MTDFETRYMTLNAGTCWSEEEIRKKMHDLRKMDEEVELEEELSKHSHMMDAVMNFRDKEGANDMNELLHENADLSEKLERWKERAQTLQQERWGFVQKWRQAKLEAKEAGAQYSEGCVDDEDGSEEEEGGGDPDGAAGSDDDW